VRDLKPGDTIDVPVKYALNPSRSITTAAIYVRVSTQDQKHDMQLTELRGYVERSGWNLVEYAEKQSSVKRRPVLERLMADARLRRFDVVLVWKLDRFARSLTQLMENVTTLDSLGVRFIAVTQGIDTDKQNAAGRFFMQIFGAFAEFERNLIVERVRAGVAEAQRQGKHCGRPKRIFRRDEALRMKAAGKSVRAIAAALGVPATTVADAMRG
jgi:DNA invertase Pin-like site-specific DNA recombinase